MAVYKRRETLITNDILKHLRVDGFAEKIHGGAAQRKGLSDIMSVYRGRSLGIEVKRPGLSATDAQRKVLDEMVGAGGLACVVHSLDELRDALHWWESLGKFETYLGDLWIPE